MPLSWDADGPVMVSQSCLYETSKGLQGPSCSCDEPCPDPDRPFVSVAKVRDRSSEGAFMTQIGLRDAPRKGRRRGMYRRAGTATSRTVSESTGETVETSCYEGGQKKFALQIQGDFSKMAVLREFTVAAPRYTGVDGPRTVLCWCLAPASMNLCTTELFNGNAPTRENHADLLVRPYW